MKFDNFGDFSDFSNFGEFDLELLAALMNSENYQNLQEALKEANLRDSSDLSGNYVIHQENGKTFLIPDYDTFIYEVIFDSEGNPIKIVEEDLLEVEV